MRRFVEHVKLKLYRRLFTVISLGVILFLLGSQLSHQNGLKYFYVNSSSKALEEERLLPIAGARNSLREKPVKYAVFCASTPNGASYRSFDYAYNLPLTALAWERIGYKSIVLIIGSRCEWENDPALRLILARLEERRGTTIFIASPLEYRQTLSQAARIFVANMKEFPGNDNDYLITTDADLWPLRKEHYIPDPNMDVMLLHWGCCGNFTMNNRTYTMYMMSNIGATVAVWRDVINTNHSFAFDTESILDYLEEMFGDQARSPVIVGEERWYMDQKLVTVRFTEWIEKHGENTVYRVSDEGFYRVDRSRWSEVDSLVPENFTHRFDAHLPSKGYLPIQQSRMEPLIHLMYGKNSWETKWVEKYNQEFLANVDNWIRFRKVG